MRSHGLISQLRRRHTTRLLFTVTGSLTGSLLLSAAFGLHWNGTKWIKTR